MNIYDYIFKENYISFAECDWALEESDESEWRPHVWTTNKGDGKYETKESGLNTELSIANVYSNTDLDRIIRKGIEKALSKYEEMFPYSGVRRYSPPRLNRYTQNTEMAEHVDHIHGLFDGTKRGIPIISVVGVLNDNYDGGEFIFNDEYEVKFNRGDILIFPSVFIYKHKVNPVKNGTRTSFVSWGY